MTTINDTQHHYTDDEIQIAKRLTGDDLWSDVDPNDQHAANEARRLLSIDPDAIRMPVYRRRPKVPFFSRLAFLAYDERTGRCHYCDSKPPRVTVGYLITYIGRKAVIHPVETMEYTRQSVYDSSLRLLRC